MPLSYPYLCPNCGSVSTVNGPPGGMSGEILLRCERCGKVAFLSPYDDQLWEMESTFATHDKAYAKLPEALEPCSCGGKFSIDAPARCPKCLAVIDLAAWHNLYGNDKAGPPISNGVAVAQWRKICAFCGREDKTLQLIDEAKNIYVCESCRTYNP